VQTAVLLIALTVGAVIVLALLGAQVSQRRAQQLRAAAAEMGFAFRETDGALALALQRLPLFGRVHVTGVRNVLHGSAQGLEVLVFDYHYAVQVGHHTQHYRATLLTFLDRQAEWPTFLLRPRQMSDRVVGLFVGGGALKDDPEFARRYVLLAPSEETAAGLFTDDVRHFVSEHPGLFANGDGPRLVISRGKLVAADDLRAFMEEGFQVLNTLHTGGQKT